jgi:hypothetical protein
MTRPPRYYFRPRLVALALCWLLGHRWVGTWPDFETISIYPRPRRFHCRRCGEWTFWHR